MAVISRVALLALLQTILGQQFFDNVIPPSARSHNGFFISRTCNGTTCQTCLNDKCYEVNGPVFACGNCPLAVCASGCFGFVMDPNTKCPVCRCEGFSTKELCHSANDCPPGHSCADSVCRYSAVPKSWTSACAFAYHCKTNEFCSGCSCVPSNNISHVEQKSCSYDNDCPAGYRCHQFTCWQVVAAAIQPHSVTEFTNGFNWLSKLFAVRRLQDGK